MKKNKLSVITFIISLLPFITLLISLFTEEITGGLQTGLIVLNLDIIWFCSFGFVSKKSQTTRCIFNRRFMC